MMRKHIYSFITIGLLVFLHASCAKQTATESVSTPANAALIGETLAKSDELFKQREDLAKLREAVKSLAAVRSPDQRNFEVEWKFAKYSYFLGKYSDDQKEQEKALENGAQAGKIASRVEPNKPDGYFWYGANLGEQAKNSPVTVGVKSIGEMQETMKKVIEIDPKYQGASAYDALAQIELETAGLMGGKPEKAVEYLEQGLKIEDNNTYLHLHLAEAYLAVGKKDEAKKQLDYLLKMKPDPEFLPEYKETTDEAKKLLATKF